MPSSCGQAAPEASSTESGRQWYVALSISTGVHLCLIVALATVWTVGKSGTQADGIDSRFVGEADSPKLQRLQPVSEPDVETTGLNFGGAAATRAAHARPQQIAVSTPLSRLATPAQAIGQLWDGDDLSDSAGVDRGSGTGRTGTAAGTTTDGTGMAVGVGHGFFTPPVEGRRFVYVVDASRSMNMPYRDVALLTRFKRVQSELVRSLGSLRSEMEFFIIFFNDVAVPMPARTLQPAEPERLEHFLRWQAQIRPDGNTDPRQALLLALQLQPDVVYFLTDGRFDSEVRRDLKKLAQQRTAIFTVALGNQSGETLLKELAAANRGEYVFVP